VKKLASEKGTYTDLTTRSY